MLDYFNSLYSFSSIALFSSLMAVATVVLFVLRLWIFYKHGCSYAKFHAKLPKLLEIQLIFLGVGIFGIVAAYMLPIIGWLALIAAIFAFLKIAGKFARIADMEKIKPEKMIFLGMGLGIAGTIGFLLGFYRGISYKEQ